MLHYTYVVPQHLLGLRFLVVFFTKIGCKHFYSKEKIVQKCKHHNYSVCTYILVCCLVNVYEFKVSKQGK